VATDFRQSTLDGAGLALRELVKKGNAEEAQVSIAMMLAYLSDIYEVPLGRMMHVALHNASQIQGDHNLLQRVKETIHNAATRDHVIHAKTDDVGNLTSHKVGDLKRHGLIVH